MPIDHVLLLATLLAATAAPAGSSAEALRPRVEAVQVPAGSAVRMDGNFDDIVWQQAAPVTGFREREPDEDADPAYPTEVPRGVRRDVAPRGGRGFRCRVRQARRSADAARPGFGQVETDPAVVNLSAFQTFFSERRPFFVEGSGIFRFDVDCNDGECSGLFYSRRIGARRRLSLIKLRAFRP
jgi:hypothetical protein